MRRDRDGDAPTVDSYERSLLRGARLLPLGDSALLIVLGDRANEQMRSCLASCAAWLEQRRSEIGYSEAVPGYASLTLHYDVAAVWRNRSMAEQDDATVFATIAARVRRSLLEMPGAASGIARIRTIEVPVCYGGKHGPDLARVAAVSGLPAEEVIALHSGADYVVHMIGFAPGFPYLGGMPERIASPRRASPRALVPAGSVGIGGTQTGVYSIASPGGWQIIGQTPLKLFCPERSVPSLLGAGDRVRFAPISQQRFLELAAVGEVEQA